MTQEGKRFRRTLIGYDRSSVDNEFDRLIEQAEALSSQREELEKQINSLNKDKAAISRDHIKLSSKFDSLSGRISELESSLTQAKAENETLTHAVEAHKADKNALQVRFEQLRERDRDYSLREREFAELQSSVASIMSVTKRASDRMFQKTVENQERVTQIAGDAAREVAAIRADMNEVREQLNRALDEVQDRIDRVDASLTGAVHKLVAIKHDDGLHTAEEQPDILSEVERLLSMRAGEVDYSDGKPYSAPVLGPYASKFVADTAKRVNDGKITARVHNGESIEVHRARPSQFDSTDGSILEASKLLERGGMTAAGYYDAIPQYKPVATPISKPKIGFTPSVEPEQFETESNIEEAAAPSAPTAPAEDEWASSDSSYTAIPLSTPDTAPTASATDGFDTANSYNSAGMYVGDNAAADYAGGYQYYPVRSYDYAPVGSSAAVNDSERNFDTEYAAAPSYANSTGGSCTYVPVNIKISKQKPKQVSVRMVRNSK